MTNLGADGLASESVSIDQRGNATTNRVWRYRDDAMEMTETKYPTSQIAALSVVSNNLAIMSVSQTGVTNTLSYDALNRQISQTDGRGNTTQTVYDENGRVSSTIDALGYATTYGYDALGRQTSVVDPLTNTVTTVYDAEGRIIAQRGATYPVDYAYNEFGEKVAMTTYRDLNSSGDTTLWMLDEATGLVTNKVYADGLGPTYTYTPDGKLATRTWARGIVTTYSYDANGSLTNTVYSDNTPAISLAYNRAGRQVCAEDAAGITTFIYDEFGSLTNETVVGVAGTNTIERYYDEYGRSTGYALNGVRQTTLSYDSVTGRISTMQVEEEIDINSPTPTNNSNSFTWSYLPGSDLKSSLAYPNGLTATWTYDANNQLLQVRNAFPTNIVSQYDYAYNAAGRRVEIVRSGSAMSETRTDYYGYNERGELIFSRRGAENAEDEFVYSYDDIGNRITSFDLGTNHTYIANNLNQYVSISNLCASASLCEEFIPQFDADGNQTLIKTKTGIWQAIYNGENRPVYWSNGATNIVMKFDRMGRRVQYLETAGATTNANNTFTYDNYLCVARHRLQTDSTSETDRFIWDPIEPTATRPLVFNYATAPPAYYTHDGNKNVSELVDENENVIAHYEYEAFGAIHIKIGIYAKPNPWQFSSEHHDSGLGLVYYNYRHYNFIKGRWLVRDIYTRYPDASLYAVADNDLIMNCDRLGMKTWGNLDAIWHYYTGGGSSVWLGSIGLYNKVSSRIVQQREGWRNKTKKEMLQRMKELTGKPVSSFPYSFTFKGHSGANSGVFWIGGFILYHVSECDITLEEVNGQCKLKGACQIWHNMDDEFVDPLDFDNSNGKDFWDHWTVGGTPFSVRCKWED